MTIGKNIKKVRLEKKLSQQKLGEKLGVSQAMIAQYETGRRIPKLETIDKIADALNVSRNMLLTDTSPSEKGAVLKAGIEEMVKSFNIEVDEIKSNTIEMTEEILAQRRKYINLYDNLNGIGQKKAVERVEELTEIPRYSKKESQEE